MITRTAELFSLGPSHKLVATLPIPDSFEIPPGIILYGERTFFLVMHSPSDSLPCMQVEAWRAPEPPTPSPEHAQAAVAGESAA